MTEAEIAAQNERTRNIPVKAHAGTLADGTEVADVFEYVREELAVAGYLKRWVDGWERPDDGAIVTAGYSYREVRVRRYLPGHKEQTAEAVIDIKGDVDLDKVETFVRPPVAEWTQQRWVA